MVRQGHRRSSRIFLTDPLWQEPLLRSVAPRPGERILDVGDAIAGTALKLAKRCPNVHIVASSWSSQPGSVPIGRLKSAGIKALPLEVGLAAARYPVDAASFDKVVATMVFYHLDPHEKLGLAREVFRVLRRGGTLHMAEMDKPETKREGYFLKIAGSVVPTESLAPHLDGTWVATLSKAGFVGIRRLSSHSLTTARVLVLRARRQ